MSRTQVIMAVAGNFTGAAIVAAFIKPVLALVLVVIAAALVVGAVVDYAR